jgi:hypothetical protein
MVLATGIWLMLNAKDFTINDYLLLRPGTNIGSTAKLFGTNLQKVIVPHNEEVRAFAQPERIRNHTMRKGCAVFCTTATTDPPPSQSVCIRAEWRQGVVFDVYFQFAAPGDQYLGRLLAGLDCTTTEFCILPPHFIVGYENEDVKETVQLCYGTIHEQYKIKQQISALLLLVLASVVYHENYLRKLFAKYPGHSFGSLPILNNPKIKIISDNLPKQKYTMGYWYTYACKA